MKKMSRIPPDQYQTIVTQPPDFDAFWDDLLVESAQIPLNATMELVPIRCTPEVEVYDVHYDSIDGVRIAGWYCLPCDQSGKLPAIVHMPGYLSDPSIPRESARQGYAAFGAAPRGKIRSNQQFNPGYPGLLTYNIVDRNTYSYRGFYIDAIRVIDFLLSRDEVDSERIGVAGSSQGGGLTIATTALRPEVRAAVAGAPFLCGFMDAIELAHTYPYQEIRDYLRLYPKRKAAVRETALTLRRVSPALLWFTSVCRTTSARRRRATLSGVALHPKTNISIPMMDMDTTPALFTIAQSWMISSKRI